jgi:hypothetical protein
MNKRMINRGGLMSELKRLFNRINKTKFPYTVNCYNLKETTVQHYNLFVYLKKMKEIQPKEILIGKQAQYSSLKTGIPFTSEHLINTFKDRHGLFNTSLYKVLGNEKDKQALFIWEQLNKLQIPPLLWNIFPFYPHQKYDHKLVRHLNFQEWNWGLNTLVLVLSAFPTIEKAIFLGEINDHFVARLPVDVEVISDPEVTSVQQFISDFNEVFHKKNLTLCGCCRKPFKFKELLELRGQLLCRKCTDLYIYEFGPI